VLGYIIIGVVIGVATELVARTFRLWIYNRASTPVLNVIIVFGFIMGVLASRVRGLGLPNVIALAFGVGLLYEIINLRVFKWWYFPSERLLFIRGHTAIVIVLALMLAVVPAAILETHALVPLAGRSLIAGSRLDRLNQRERQLMQKLDGLRERARAVETQLDEVRMLKQALVGRQAVRRLESQDANPPPTP
jgi:hypothetical protein